MNFPILKTKAHLGLNNSNDGYLKSYSSPQLKLNLIPNKDWTIIASPLHALHFMLQTYPNSSKKLYIL